jgi:membrane-bound metal-dependent hydrolase YbcI (DUF457 family)
MDTITHAFAGALLGKGLFTTRRSECPTEHSSQAGVAIFAVTLGSAFPDVDIIFDRFIHDNLAMLKYHRYITHSLILLPLWALLLTPVIRWGARKFGYSPPSFLWTFLATAVGIASHLLLDLVTSFGTMIWSPISRARPAWDILFIVDFTFAAILLVPQFAAWIHRFKAHNILRASRMWALSTVLALGILWFVSAVGFPFSIWVVPIASIILAAVFFLPLIGNRGVKIQRSTWARFGLLAAAAYLLLCTYAHHVALKHVRDFAAAQKIEAQDIAALPLAPSLLDWYGLILTDHGVYRLDETLLSKSTVNLDFFPDTPPDRFLAIARTLPDVQTYLWFSRFPIFRVHPVEGNIAVDITDIRFKMGDSLRTPSFTYRVTLDPSGAVVQQGMLRANTR